MSKKIAFTLLELMIVIVLISIIYGIFINKISKDENNKGQIGLKTLKNYLSKLEFKKSAEIICYSPCDNCQIYIDNSPSSDFKLFDNPPEVFKFDRYGSLEKIDFGFKKIHGKLKKICFKFQLFNNQSSSSYILKSGDLYYIYYPILQDVKVTNSFSKAKELFDTSKLITPQFNY